MKGICMLTPFPQFDLHWIYTDPWIMFFILIFAAILLLWFLASYLIRLADKTRYEEKVKQESMTRKEKKKEEWKKRVKARKKTGQKKKVRRR